MTAVLRRRGGTLRAGGEELSMRALRDAAGAELELTRTYRRRAELRADAELVGTLERQSWWRQHVLLTAAEGQWMLRWSGWLARQAVVTTTREAGERVLGSYRAGWRGDGTLALPDGRELQLTRPRGWRMTRTLCDNGAELVTLRPHGLKGGDGRGLGPPGAAALLVRAGRLPDPHLGPGRYGLGGRGSGGDGLSGRRQLTAATVEACAGSYRRVGSPCMPSCC